MSRRPIVLFVAEAVTLAHYARVMALADALPASRYDIAVATDPRFASVGPPSRHQTYPLSSIASSAFAQALARGRPLYDEPTLRGYVDDDIAVIRRVRPDLIVGDFRLSLAVSAPATRTPCAAIVNAYWSPYALVDFPVPDLPMTRVLGVGIAQWIFDAARRFAFRAHARPLDRVRESHGLSSLGGDLRTAYTSGDHTLYADVPGYVPMRSLPPSHRHIGPPLWSTGGDLPGWWNELPTDKPMIFVTLGTSGTAALLPRIVATLATLPVTALVATAGSVINGPLPGNVRIADFVPLDAIAPRCSLIICNGGSLTTYGAAVAGVPVLGICTNLDQLLNMQSVDRRGAGIALRASACDGAALRQTITTLLADAAFRHRAGALGAAVEAFDGPQKLRQFVAEVIG